MTVHTSIRIVIVDDHQMVRETWKMLLQKDQRIEIVDECASGEEAILSAATHSPDVMLMDINMSPMNGFEATKKINKNNPRIKIIGVSVNNQPSYAKNMLQSGAKGYVTKSSPREEMLKAIIEVHKGNNFICKEVKEQMQ